MMPDLYQHLLVAAAIFVVAFIWLSLISDYWKPFWKDALYSVLLAAVLFYPMSHLLTMMVVAHNTEVEQREARIAAWQNDKRSAGCKQSSFVATKNTIHPVWTCPDGQAHIEPSN